MKSYSVNYVIVGVFVLAMLSAALGTAAILSGRSGSYDRYDVILDNVADVKFGTQVRFEGYPVGQVERIQPFVDAETMRFRLQVSVLQGWRLPSDSTARIGASSFLAAKTIDIESGRAPTALAPGGEIVSAAPADIFTAMAGVAAELGDLSQSGIRPIIRRVDALLESADGLLERDAGRLLETLNRMAETVEGDLPRMTASLLDFTARLNQGADAVQEVLSPDNVAAVRRVLLNVEATSESLGGLSALSKQTLLKVDGLVAGLDELLAENRGEVDGAVQDVRYILRSIARNIDAINHNLDGSARNMNEFSRLIRRNPGLLLGGAPREEVSAPRAPGRRGEQRSRAMSGAEQ